MIENFLMTVLSEHNFPIFANWLTLSFFFSRINGWGVLTSGLAYDLASDKSGPACSTNLYDINRKPSTRAFHKSPQNSLGSCKRCKVFVSGLLF